MLFLSVPLIIDRITAIISLLIYFCNVLDYANFVISNRPSQVIILNVLDSTTHHHRWDFQEASLPILLYHLQTKALRGPSQSDREWNYQFLEAWWWRFKSKKWSYRHVSTFPRLASCGLDCASCGFDCQETPVREVLKLNTVKQRQGTKATFSTW